MITVVTAELVFDPVSVEVHSIVVTSSLNGRCCDHRPFFAPYCDTMTFTWSEGQAPYTIVSTSTTRASLSLKLTRFQRISTPDMVYALQSDITATSVGWVANAEGSRGKPCHLEDLTVWSFTHAFFVVDTADGGELTAWVRDASGSTAYSMKFGLYNTVSDNGTHSQHHLILEGLRLISAARRCRQHARLRSDSGDSMECTTSRSLWPYVNCDIFDQGAQINTSPCDFHRLGIFFGWRSYVDHHHDLDLVNDTGHQPNSCLKFHLHVRRQPDYLFTSANICLADQRQPSLALASSPAPAPHRVNQSKL
jgi:hypothetical protein